jgi:hypothetical protein
MDKYKMGQELYPRQWNPGDRILLMPESSFMYTESKPMWIYIWPIDDIISGWFGYPMGDMSKAVARLIVRKLKQQTDANTVTNGSGEADPTITKDQHLL